MSNAGRRTLSIPSKAAAVEAPAPVEAAAPAAPAADPFKSIAPTINRRNEVLDDLALRSMVETGNDSEIALDETTYLEGSSDETPDDPVDPYLPVTADEPEPTGGAPAAVAVPFEAPPAEVKMHKVEARGVVADIPEDKVIEAGLHALRHHGAAEMALREANALLTQARGIAPQPAAQQGPAPASTPEDAQQLAEALQFGSKEDAAKAVAAMMTRGVASQDVNEVVARTVETRVRDVLDQDKAAKQLETQVPEMLTDRRVLAIMATEERAARASGDTRPYTQLYPEIGQKIRGWLDGFKTPPVPATPGVATPSATIAARAAAKAAVPSAVPARGAAPAAPAQPRAPTGSEIVAQMRASRGRRMTV